LRVTLRELAFSQVKELIHHRVSVFKPDDTASKVLGILSETGRYEAVVSYGNLAGIVTVRDLLDVDQPSRTKIERIWNATGSISPNDNLIDITGVLIKNNIRAVPVMENGRILGIISQFDIISALCNVSELSGINAREVARSPVLTLGIDEKISYARSLMIQKDISHIPIVDHGRLVGVVTAESIVNAFITPLSKITTGDRIGEKSRRFPGRVAGIMDLHPLTIGPKESILEVVCEMRDQKKSACFVVDDDEKIKGILTPKELMQLLTRYKAKEELPVYIIGLSDEDFFEKAVAEEKVRRIVSKSMKFRPDITEVSIRIRDSKTRGNRTRYELTAHAISPRGIINANAEGWDLLQVFDELCDILETTIIKSKVQTPSRYRKRRGRT